MVAGSNACEAAEIRVAQGLRVMSKADSGTRCEAAPEALLRKDFAVPRAEGFLELEVERLVFECRPSNQAVPALRGGYGEEKRVEIEDRVMEFSLARMKLPGWMLVSSASGTDHSSGCEVREEGFRRLLRGSQERGSFGIFGNAGAEIAGEWIADRSRCSKLFSSSLMSGLFGGCELAGLSRPRVHGFAGRSNVVPGLDDR